jgi:site-specific DNA recombinase
MSICFAYIRVSDAYKQGKKGVSLPEQRDAIKRYAVAHNLTVIQWFEERKTAAKRGRLVFTKMLALLKKRKATGVIIHKIDRSARNLHDWLAIGDLSDAGFAIHFAGESVDLNTRGGRLSADIQAVVAADYIRNLREETIKGFYGRLKQGIYPLPAPLGYLDRGKGKAKEIDPARGPLVRRTFELYDSGRYTLETLSEELYRIGLRSKKGEQVTRNGLSVILNNPFYMGVISIRKRNESFAGIHAPLISRALFERVQDRLRGRVNVKVVSHDFEFRRLFTCEFCDRTLTGEVHHKWTYYRCHTQTCLTRCVPEPAIRDAVRLELIRLSFSGLEQVFIEQEVERATQSILDRTKTGLEILHAGLGQVRMRLERMTDALIDGLIEKAVYEERRQSLLARQQELQVAIKERTENPQRTVEKLQAYFEFANSAWLSYSRGEVPDKRSLLKRVTSKRSASPQNVAVELSFPFALMAKRLSIPDCDPRRAADRREENLSSGTKEKIPQPDIYIATLVDKVLKWVLENPVDPIEGQ